MVRMTFDSTYLYNGIAACFNQTNEDIYEVGGVEAVIKLNDICEQAMSVLEQHGRTRFTVESEQDVTDIYQSAIDITVALAIPGLSDLDGQEYDVLSETLNMLSIAGAYEAQELSGLWYHLGENYDLRELDAA